MTNFKNLEQFESTYDRHKDLYGYRYSDFPKSYHPSESALSYTHDQDWTVKFQKPRLKIKRMLILLALLGLWIDYKSKQVMKFDHLKRLEQRAMQNKEVVEFKDKKAEYIIFKPDGKEYEPEPGSYQVLWFDSKMKNYELLVEFFKKKRIIRAQVVSMLVVD